MAAALPFGEVAAGRLAVELMLHRHDALRTMSCKPRLASDAHADANGPHEGDGGRVRVCARIASMPVAGRAENSQCCDAKSVRFCAVRCRDARYRVAMESVRVRVGLELRRGRRKSRLVMKNRHDDGCAKDSTHRQEHCESVRARIDPAGDGRTVRRDRRMPRLWSAQCARNSRVNCSVERAPPSRSIDRSKRSVSGAATSTVPM